MTPERISELRRDCERVDAMHREFDDRVAKLHWHCEWGCQKVVFVTVDGRLRCASCGGAAVNEPDCDCIAAELGKGEQ